jgi:hypothetical protein
MIFRLLMLLAAILLPMAGGARAEPRQVQVAVHVNDIQQISIKTHSFYADLYVGLRWTDPGWRPSQTLTWMNPYQLWAHITRPMSGEPRQMPDGSLFEWIRVRGEFNVPLALRDYPMDRQVLVAEFEDRAHDSASLVYLPAGVSLAADLDVPGFLVGTPRLVVSSSRGAAALEQLSTTSSGGFSRMRLEIPVTRPFMVYFLKLGLPLLIMTACAGLVFFLPPRHVDARIGLGITSLLVMVGLHMTLNNELPEINYLTRLDGAYLASYLFGFGSLLTLIWVTRRHGGDLASAAARRMNRRCGLAVCALYLALVVHLLVLATLGV